MPMSGQPNCSQLVNNLRKSFRDGLTKTLEARKGHLAQIRRLMEQHREELYETAYKDTRRPGGEFELLEIRPLIAHLEHASQCIAKWMAPTKVKGDLMNKMNKCQILKDPLGVVLIVSAWYAPLATALIPLVTALAAGNCVAVHMSNLSPHTSNLLKKLFDQYLLTDVVCILDGNEFELSAVLELKFDLIYYSGERVTGRTVMKAAAQHLARVVVERRGKCPAVVDPTCDMDVVAHRITYGKFVNCGQNPHAPDYVLCMDGCVGKFADAMKSAISKIYGSDPKECEHYGRIVNREHFQRLVALIDPIKVLAGNIQDADSLYLSPTLMCDVAESDAVMRKEIFGPILPILSVEDVKNAVDFINNRDEHDKPPHVYVFTNDVNVADVISRNLFCHSDILVNNLLGHVSVLGVSSPVTFDMFSHSKSYLGKTQGLESVNAIRYPPYKERSKVLKLGEWAVKPKV